MGVTSLLFLFNIVFSQAQPLRIAVAASGQAVIKLLRADFKKRHGIETDIIIGSSGKLYAQIKNGAPYHVFLSADTELPDALFREGFGLTVPKVYAFGSLIICCNSVDLNNWKQLITSNKVAKVAIANPSLAPYGKAAEQVLKHYSLLDKIKTKLVYGESIAQVNTYIRTGVVDLSFTSESFLYEGPTAGKIRWVRADSKLYTPLAQSMLVLKAAEKDDYKKALLFFKYLQSPAAKLILNKNGYRAP